MYKGPKEMRRFEGDNAVEVMAERVVKKTLDRAGLKPSDIDFIIAGNLGGKYGIPMVGTHIHYVGGFPREVPVLNMQNCCAGFIDGINLAWNLVKAGEYKRVLVVMVTAFDAKGKAMCVVDQTSPMAKFFGDGSGAAIVSTQNLKCEFLSYTNETYGEAYEHLYSILKPADNPELLKDPNDSMGNYLYADEWFYDFMFSDKIRDAKRWAINDIKKALQKAHLKLSDLDFIAFHQAGDAFIRLWIEGGEEAGLKKEQWKELWDKYGNIGNVDVVPQLEELWQEGKLHNGSIVALWVPGGGIHVPCMILKWMK
jgi:3-oxoacyl-[acyl-carrier-protein] synthase-3